MMRDEVGNRRRIARNTLMLYVRMLLSTVVTLYTSRVVLNVLGVEDYGVYTVVGGVVSMFTFLNASMSGATSRFLTFELGRGGGGRLAKTFTSAFYVHLGIALAILVVAETAGLWLVAHKLVIPEGRMGAAHVVYQCSVLAMMVTVTQVPYNASIIAHERMDVYAYVELLNVALKLGIVYLLYVGAVDKLVLYAILILAESVTIALVYRLYCLRNFGECHLCGRPSREVVLPMVKFSLLDLYGNMSVSVRQQGINILVNLFFGPALNAAAGIASRVNATVMGLANNVVVAFRPQIIKRYAEGELRQMQELLVSASKYSFCLFFVVAVPLFAEVDYVLGLWLGVVPERTAFFLKVVLACCPFLLGRSILNIGIHATGDIRRLSFVTGTLYLLTLPVLYVAMKSGLSLELSYSFLIVESVIVLAATFGILKSQVPELRLSGIVLRGYLPGLGMAAAVSAGMAALHGALEPGIVRLLLSCAASVLISAAYVYAIVLSGRQRTAVIAAIRSRLRRLARP